jgi:hypothetical protein
MLDDNILNRFDLTDIAVRLVDNTLEMRRLRGL